MLNERSPNRPSLNLSYQEVSVSPEDHEKLRNRSFLEALKGILYHKSRLINECTSIMQTESFSVRIKVANTKCVALKKTAQIEQLIAIYNEYREILNSWTEESFEVNELKNHFTTDAFALATTQLQKQLSTNTSMISPLKIKPSHVKQDCQHAYCLTGFFGLPQAALTAAENYDNHLRLGFAYLIDKARKELEQLESESKLEKKIEKKVSIISKAFGVDGRLVTMMSGPAPDRGGTKELYNVLTPSGTQCLIGLRTMGKPEEDNTNYCCYPLASLDDKSRNWKSYQDIHLQEISIETPNDLSRRVATITGIHLTISCAPPLTITVANVGKRFDTRYLSNGSHTTIDLESNPSNNGINAVEERKIEEPEIKKPKIEQHKIRVQFRPRIEIVKTDDEDYIVRCGRPILVPMILECRTSSPAEKWVSSLRALTFRPHEGFLAQKNVVLSDEQEFLNRLMQSTFYLTGQAVISEIAVIGKLLEHSYKINLKSSDEEKEVAYRKINTLLEDDVDILSHYHDKLRADEGEDDVVQPLSARVVSLRLGQ